MLKSLYDQIYKNTNKPRHTGRNKWHNNELKVALGLKPSAKLPDTHMTTQYQGYTVTLISKLERDVHYQNTRNNRGHRLLVMCPTCFKFVPAGRISQHEARKDHQNTIDTICNEIEKL